jgi:hypothetical protein
MNQPHELSRGIASADGIFHAPLVRAPASGKA